MKKEDRDPDLNEILFTVLFTGKNMAYNYANQAASACLSLRTAAKPIPSAMIKGTVMGPVVTPPESNATATKSFGTNNVRTATRI